MRSSRQLRRARRSAATERAFTLIELLLAFALFAMVLTATYNAIYHAGRTKEAARRRADLLRAGVSFLTRLDRELGAAYIEMGSGKRSPRTLFRAETFDAQIPRDAIVFTCACNEIWTYGLYDSNRTPHAEVAYDFIYDNEVERTMLVRRQDDSMDSDPIAGGLSDSMWEALRGMNLRFLDPVDKVWKDSWDSASRSEAPLPQAVEVTLWLAEPEGEGEDLENPLILGRTFVLPSVFPKSQ